MWFAQFFKGHGRNFSGGELPAEISSEERRKKRRKTKASRKANRVMRAHRK